MAHFAVLLSLPGLCLSLQTVSSAENAKASTEAFTFTAGGSFLVASPQESAATWNTSLTSPSEAEVAKMIMSQTYQDCAKLLQKYGNPSTLEGVGHTTPVSGTDWRIQDIPVSELECNSACHAPPWLCGKYVIRVWLVGDGGQWNFGTIKLAADGTTPPSKPGKTVEPGSRYLNNYRNLVETPSSWGSLLVAATFSPPSHATDWLVLGMGSGGRGVMLTEMTPWRVDMAEIDGRVVDVAQQYFQFPQLPNKGALNERCNEDGRICVAVEDGCAYAKALAGNKRQYAMIHVDFLPPNKMSEECMRPLTTMTEVAVLNPWGPEHLEAGFALMQKLFKKVLCLPLGPDDFRKCFVVGLGSKALSQKAAYSQAAELDSGMSWAPFSAVKYMDEYPLTSSWK